jgi:hypothetical protein
MKYKKGDILVKYDGTEMKILTVIDDVAYLTSIGEGTGVIFTMADREIDLLGYTLKSRPKEDWTPRMLEEYWFVSNIGATYDTWENAMEDKQRKEALGVYKTKEEAQKVFDDIKEFLKTRV